MTRPGIESATSCFRSGRYNHYAIGTGQFAKTKAYAKTKRRNCKADQRLCFHYMNYSRIPLLHTSEISSLPSSLTVQAGLRRILSKTTLLLFSRRGSYHIYIYIETKSKINALYITCKRNSPTEELGFEHITSRLRIPLTHLHRLSLSICFIFIY